VTLPEFSVRQTVLVNVLFVVCMVGGWNALQLTEVEYYHDVTLNQAVITTAWPGASADEVERLITAKIEEKLLTVGNIDEMRSASQSNISMISVDFDETLGGVDYESAVNDVRAALDQVQDLPLDAEEPELNEIITSEVSPIIMLAVTDVGGVGELPIRDVAREAQSRLRELQGVSTVEVRGLQEREVRVLVDRARASVYGLTVEDIAERVRRKNQNIPAGTFQDALGEATLRATGDYASVEQILDTVIRDDGAGTRVLLRDVARAEKGLEKQVFISRYNGYPAAVISVGKKDKTDVRALSARVDRWVDGFAPLLPAGIELTTTLDTTDFVTPRVSVLLNNLSTGMFFVLALLWFTIGFRNALLTVIAIPFSFLTAIIFFPVLDISVNSNTLIGMLLVSGMLVDDAIIVLENIYRRVEGGEELRAAVIGGANEVLWPVTAAVMTTVAAFAPLLLVGGTAGKFVEVLPKCVVVCLLASLFECLVILPAHYIEFGSRRVAGESRSRGGWTRATGAISRLRLSMDKSFDRLRIRYRGLLRPVIEHRLSFNLLLFSVILAAFAGATRLPVVLFPGEYQSFTVSLEAEPDYSLAQTAGLVDRIEAELRRLPATDVQDFNTTVGIAIDLNYDRIVASNLALIYVAIAQTEENQLSPEMVLYRVRSAMDALRRESSEGIVELRVEPQPYGPPLGRPVEVRIQSEDFSLNRTLADEVKAYLRTIPGVSGVDDNLKEGPREIRLRIDEARAGQYGLTFEDLARSLRSANDGIVTSSFRSPSATEDDDIRVLLESDQRDRIVDLLEVVVPTPDGRLVRLADVADLEVARGYLAYRRVDGKRAVTVFGDVDDDLATSTSVNRELAAQFAAIRTRFPQVDIVYGGEFQESNEAIANTLAAFPVALLLIYMILATLFRSYVQPLIVLTAIPLGFAGIVFGVGVFGYTVSFNLLYASVGLAGVVVNDALVMVDFINRARREGLSLPEALLQSGERRLRPVVLTTLTTVVALLPMALGIQGASRTYGPFASSIAFGLLFAMLGTLFVVPLSYATFAQMDLRVRGGLRRVRRSIGRESTGAAS
jgi:HAE1 family hydrophobic/amphiphilic exporter-1